MSKRVTIALNSDRNTKTITLITSSNDGNIIREHLDKIAASKLRLKVKKGTTSRIFSSTGTELSNDDLVSLLSDDLLLISGGQDYIGKTSCDPRPSNTFTSVNLFDATYVETDALTQLDSAARTLPGIIRTVAQPDLHPGNKFPIGAVLVSKGFIHPPLIGGDIGCGMGWYRLNMNASQLEGEKGRRIAEKLRGLEGEWLGQEERRAWLKVGTGEIKEGRDTGKEDSGMEELEHEVERNRSLSTIGAGNHFAEIQVIGPIADPDCPLRENEVLLLVHSGSRGYGSDILRRYSTCKDQTSFPDTSDEARRFLGCLENANKDWTVEGGRGDEELGAARDRLRSRKVVDIWHNNMSKVDWDGGHAWIHRKGAAPTHDTTGQLLPILPLPGSRATPTAVLRPLADPPINNAFSVSHGAGRAMTRLKALQSLPGKYKHDHLGMLGAGGGTWVVCEDKKLIWEEAPDAYKDIKAVAGDLQAKGLVEIMGWCEPRVCYKVRMD